MISKRKILNCMQLKMPLTSSMVIMFLSLFAIQPLHSENAVSFSSELMQKEDSTIIYTVVDKNPSFPGGINAMDKFIAANIKYPENAKELDLKGIVFASFVVEKDGSISNIKIIKNLDEDCDREVIRVIKSMPKWTPGYQKGKPVRVEVRIPVDFELRDNEPK